MKRILYLMLAAFLALPATACADRNKEVNAFISGEPGQSVSSSSDAVNSVYVDENNEDAVYGTITTVSFKKSDFFFDHTEKEYSQILLSGNTAESDNAGVITENGYVTITDGGIYVLSGTFDGTIAVKASDDKKVYLVLDNVTVNGIDGPAVCAESADKLIVLLPPNSVNKLSDAVKYCDTSDDAPNATLFARCDLTINGSGSLTVIGNNNNAILSKDDCRIMSGNIAVESVDDGIVGRDLLAVADGIFTINAGSHALKTSNDEDAGKGDCLILNGTFNIVSGEDAIHSSENLEICGGDYEIAAGDDAMHADNHVVINAGTVNIEKCHEGLEGFYVTVNGGGISIACEDDAVNAADGTGYSQEPGMPGMWRNNSFDNRKDTTSGGENTETPCIYINGGSMVIDADGDGLDSNGNIEMTGGFVLVNGPANSANNATDYDGTFLMNGGMMIAAGTKEMYQSVSKGSACAVIDYISDTTIKEGTTCSFYNADNLMYEFVIAQNSDAIMIAGDCLEVGKSYILKVGDNDIEVTASEAASEGGFQGQGGFMGPQGFNGFNGPNGSSGPDNPNGFNDSNVPGDSDNPNPPTDFNGWGKPDYQDNRENGNRERHG